MLANLFRVENAKSRLLQLRFGILSEADMIIYQNNYGLKNNARVDKAMLSTPLLSVMFQIYVQS